MTGLPPFYSRNTEEIKNSILYQKLKIPSLPLSQECIHLLVSLLKKNPADRLGYKNGIKEIINHPWVQKDNMFNRVKNNEV